MQKRKEVVKIPLSKATNKFVTPNECFHSSGNPPNGRVRTTLFKN